MGERNLQSTSRAWARCFNPLVLGLHTSKFHKVCSGPGSQKYNVPKACGKQHVAARFFPPTVHLSSLPCFPTRNFSSPSTDRSRQYCLEACILLSGCWPGFWDPSACLASRKELLILSRPSSTIAPCTPIPNFPVVSTWVTSGHVIQLPSLHGSFWQPIYLPSNSP